MRTLDVMGPDSYNVLTVGTALIPMGGADFQVDEYRFNRSFHLYL